MINVSCILYRYISLPINQLDKVSTDAGANIKLELFFFGHERPLLLADPNELSRGSFGSESHGVQRLE